MAGWLREDQIPFQREVPIGRCHVDVLIGETAIELNGCYFHGHDKCQKLTAEQKLARKKDTRRYAFLRSRGYRLVVIWECEVKKSPDEVRNRLRKMAKQESANKDE